MSILSGLTPPSRNQCFVVKHAEALSKEDRAILMAAVDDPRWSITALNAELGRRGLKISRAVLDRHRKRLCACNA